MSASATIALRSAVRDALLANVPLVTRLNGNHIYDETPGDIEPPYVSFGDTRARDWSSASGFGTEHSLVLEIWSKHHGVFECLEITGLVDSVLNEATLILTGHDLVLLRQQSLNTIRRDRGRLALARTTYKALTEAH